MVVFGPGEKPDREAVHVALEAVSQLAAAAGLPLASAMLLGVAGAVLFESEERAMFEALGRHVEERQPGLDKAVAAAKAAATKAPNPADN